MTQGETDVSRCPCGHRCESCGAAGPRLAVAVVQVLAEVMCLTLCPACASSGRAPQIMLSTAEKLVAQHREHVDERRERTVLRRA